MALSNGGAIIGFLVVAMATSTTASDKPNIIILLGDDIGNADYEAVDPAMRTPALLNLARNGVVLNQSYVLQTCVPTRTALLTGRYAHTLGMQVGKIKGTSLRYVPVEPKMLPASLRELGYTTHAVGKWHLGFCDWKLTPRYRGFDTFYGFLSGSQGYFTHSGKRNSSFDFRDNGRVAWETAGHYSTELHTTRVQRIIKDRGNKPFFIYMAYQNAHGPYEVKQRYIDDYCSHVSEPKRRIHCAMVAAMDESIQNITRTLDREGIANNTLILYLSDNGGPLGQGSFNWPLRGGKSTLWEGGVRSVAVLSYPDQLGQAAGTAWDSLIHATDWYPTLYKAAGGNPAMLTGLDGIDQYQRILKGRPGLRDRMVVNIDDRRKRAAVRIGDMKLFIGRPCYNTRTCSIEAPDDMVAANTATTVRQKPDSVPKKQLFNVRLDPSESNNLIDDPNYADTVSELEQFLADETKRLVPFPAKIPKVKEGDPSLYSNTFSPGWCCV